jgi:hypothetical protein
MVTFAQYRCANTAGEIQDAFERASDYELEQQTTL